MDNTGEWQKDKINRQILGASSIPAGPNVNTANVTIAAGTSKTFVVTTTPDASRLSVWNFLFSIIVDSTADDSNGDFANILYEGTGLTSGQLAARITQWLDWAVSDDQTNTRVHKIHIENLDTSDHTYYLYYKAYTISSNPAS